MADMEPHAWYTAEDVLEGVMLDRTKHTDAAAVVALVVPTISLIAAYGSQRLADLVPCHLCLQQRWPHFAAILLALLAMFPGIPLRAQRLLIACAAGAIATTGMIGAFHAGVEYGWWTYVSPCTGSMTTTGTSAIEAIMAAPLVRCDEAAFRFLGISMAGWNAVISLATASFIAVTLFRTRRTSTP